jgi:hypothetical protein
MISRRRAVAASIRSSAKSIALFAAAVIVAAQFLALAHIHQRNPTRLLNAQSQVVADDRLCALCLLAFHAPINPAVAPAVERPYAEIRLVNAAIARLHLSASYSSCRTRAPPAALA